MSFAAAFWLPSRDEVTTAEPRPRDLPDDDLLAALGRGLAEAPEAELLAAADTLTAIHGPAPAGTAAAYDWRALSVRQPWANAILRGPKDVENRATKTNRRGPILIHSSQHYDHSRGPAPALDRWMRSGGAPCDWTFGAILGVATVEDCHRCDGSCSEWAEPESWHWVLGGRQLLPEPVLCRGALGFWRPTPDVLAAVLKQIGGAP